MISHPTILQPVPSNAMQATQCKTTSFFSLVIFFSLATCCCSVGGNHYRLFTLSHSVSRLVLAHKLFSLNLYSAFLMLLSRSKMAVEKLFNLFKSQGRLQLNSFSAG